jgi:hypothetical protein
MPRKHSPLFIVYPAIVAGTSDPSAAAPEFHRYIAAQRIAQLFGQLGDIAGADSADDINAIADAANARQQQPVAICFSQPQWLPPAIRCKTIAAFSWSYETVPNESWGEYPRHDWRVALKNCAGIIGFSQHTSNTIAATLDAQLPIFTIIPPPEIEMPRTMAAAANNPTANKPAANSECHLDIHGVVFDTQALGFDDASQVCTPDFAPQSSRIQLHGAVYTAVLDPIDDAKNWLDTLYGFGIAFRDNPDVTLVLKLCHPDTQRQCFTVSHWIQKLVPLRCRIVVIIAHLPPDQYAVLLRNSSFYLSTAHAHGKAHAMLEFMAAGVPVIAPRHTATTVLLDDGNSFAIDCSREWTFWPHDARQRLTTYRYRVVWESVRQQLLQSLQVFLHAPERYRQLAAQAQADGLRHGAPDLPALAAWLTELGIAAQPSEARPIEARPIEARPKVLPATAFGDKLAAPALLRRLLRRVADVVGNKKPRQ